MEVGQGARRIGGGGEEDLAGIGRGIERFAEGRAVAGHVQYLFRLRGGGHADRAPAPGRRILRRQQNRVALPFSQAITSIC